MTSLREVRLLKRLSHPNCVSLKDVAVGKGREGVFLVFEYCEHDMASLCENMAKTFSESEVKGLMVQLLRAVAYLHANWIVHRDLKLSNLLYNSRGELKLADFGLARLYGDPPRPMTPKGSFHSTYFGQHHFGISNITVTRNAMVDMHTFCDIAEH